MLAGDLALDAGRRSFAALHYQKALEASERLGRTDWEGRTLGFAGAWGISSRAQRRLEWVGSSSTP